jgi:cysteine-rich repeat protein
MGLLLFAAAAWSTDTNNATIADPNFTDLSTWLADTHCGAYNDSVEDKVGCVVAVVHGNRITAMGVHGWADIENERAATYDDVFQIGSVSKLYSVLLLSKLLDSGPLDPDGAGPLPPVDLSWSSTLEEAMPWVTANNPTWNFRKTKTLRQLASMRAGYGGSHDQDVKYCKTNGKPCTVATQEDVCDSGVCEFKVLDGDPDNPATGQCTFVECKEDTECPIAGSACVEASRCENDYHACTDHSECSSGICEDGACTRTTCATDADCPATDDTCHLANITATFTAPGWRDSTPKDVRNEESRLLSIDPAYHPIPHNVNYEDTGEEGEENDYAYANGGAAVISAIIEYWSNAGMREVLQDNLVTPLSMTSFIPQRASLLALDPSTLEGTAAQKAVWDSEFFDNDHPYVSGGKYYVPATNPYLNILEDPMDTTELPPFIKSHGGFGNSISDAARFTIHLTRGFEPYILEMTREKNPQYKKDHYLGSNIDEIGLTDAAIDARGHANYLRTRRMLNKGGNIDGAKTIYQYVPESDISYIVWVRNANAGTIIVRGQAVEAPGTSAIAESMLAHLREIYPAQNIVEPGFCQGNQEKTCSTNAHCTGAGEAPCVLGTPEKPVSHGCRDSTLGGVVGSVANVQRFYTPSNPTTDPASGFVTTPKMFGCAGTVRHGDRATLCAPGYHTCTAAEFVARNTDNERPMFNYWVEESGLKRDGTSGSCTVSLNQGQLCPTVFVGGGSGGFGTEVSLGPIRVTTDSHIDHLNHQTDVIECGLNTDDNQWFGGCAPNPENNTAGTLCCGDMLVTDPPECGDEIITFGEECDDGNSVNTDTCTNDCHFNNGPPSECDGDCGTDEGELCADVETFQVTGTEESHHPDGNFSATKRCWDDYYDNEGPELVCVPYNGDNNSPGVCRSCAGTDKEIGCTCSTQLQDCGGDLTCVPTAGYDSQNPASLGRCASMVPSELVEWECQANCYDIYGDRGYCYHGEFGYNQGVTGHPICAFDDLDYFGELNLPVQCAMDNKYWDIKNDACVVECDGNDPQNDTTCDQRGYSFDFHCNAAGSCVL